jgi:hypothetical protein
MIHETIITAQMLAQIGAFALPALFPKLLRKKRGALCGSRFWLVPN